MTKGQTKYKWVAVTPVTQSEVNATTVNLEWFIKIAWFKVGLVRSASGDNENENKKTKKKSVLT